MIYNIYSTYSMKMYKPACNLLVSTRLVHKSEKQLDEYTDYKNEHNTPVNTIAFTIDISQVMKEGSFPTTTKSHEKHFNCWNSIIAITQN